LVSVTRASRLLMRALRFVLPSPTRVLSSDTRVSTALTPDCMAPNSLYCKGNHQSYGDAEALCTAN
jgi:hypothetical protein